MFITHKILEKETNTPTPFCICSLTNAPPIKGTQALSRKEIEALYVSTEQSKSDREFYCACGNKISNFYWVDSKGPYCTSCAKSKFAEVTGSSNCYTNPRILSLPCKGETKQALLKRHFECTVDPSNIF